MEGTTGADGIFRYEFTVPDYFVGQLENASASVDLEIAVADTAQHVERIDESVTVAEQPILVDAVPESGVLRRGLANLVYIDTTYPDGSAAKTTLTVESNRLPAPLTLETDEYGLAVITMTAGAAATTSLKVTAEDRGRPHRHAAGPHGGRPGEDRCPPAAGQVRICRRRDDEPGCLRERRSRHGLPRHGEG